MKLLFVSAVYPPKIIGGAEIIAHNTAIWMSRQGLEVGVLTVAENREDELHGELVDGIRIWRLVWPRHHTQHKQKQQNRVSKLIWHLQDHFDPRNAKLVNRVITEFQPDVVNVQVAQGIGHNALRPSKYPTTQFVYVLHDMVLACIRTSMYRDGNNCEKQCRVCSLSSKFKMSFLRGHPNVQFVSPSSSNLDILDKLINLREFPCNVVPNIDLDTTRPNSAHIRNNNGGLPRFIYIGRLDKTKGVEFILAVLKGIALKGHKFEMTVVGGGPEEETLRKKYSSEPWVTFTGKVAPNEVNAFLIRSDVLLLPSLWRENHPGVVRQALRSGVPAIVSDIGGPKEMIVHGTSGLSVKVGDARAWHEEITTLLEDPSRIKVLQAGAVLAGDSYSADALGRKLLEALSDGHNRTNSKIASPKRPDAPQMDF